jgi:hypothetical protein
MCLVPEEQIRNMLPDIQYLSETAALLDAWQHLMRFTLFPKYVLTSMPLA